MIAAGGELVLDVPRAALWAALDDPERLRDALPNVDDLVLDGQDGFEATIRPALALGEVPFTTRWRRVERRPPALLRYAVDGRSGEHLMRVEAELWLADAEPGTTPVRWEADCRFTGVLRGVGQRTLLAVVRHQAELVLRAAARVE